MKKYVCTLWALLLALSASAQESEHLVPVLKKTQRSGILQEQHDAYISLMGNDCMYAEVDVFPAMFSDYYYFSINGKSESDGFYLTVATRRLRPPFEYGLYHKALDSLSAKALIDVIYLAVKKSRYPHFNHDVFSKEPLLIQAVSGDPIYYFHVPYLPFGGEVNGFELNGGKVTQLVACCKELVEFAASEAEKPQPELMTRIHALIRAFNRERVIEIDE